MVPPWFINGTLSRTLTKNVEKLKQHLAWEKKTWFARGPESEDPVRAQVSHCDSYWAPNPRTFWDTDKPLCHCRGCWKPFKRRACWGVKRGDFFSHKCWWIKQLQLLQNCKQHVGLMKNNKTAICWEKFVLWIMGVPQTQNRDVAVFLFDNIHDTPFYPTRQTRIMLDNPGIRSGRSYLLATEKVQPLWISIEPL